MLNNSRVLNLLHRRQQKERRAMEKAVVSYQHHDLNDPGRGLEPDKGQMMLPGLTGEDPECETRQQRQKHQLRGWLIQQQNDQTAQRRQQDLDGWFKRAAV